MPRPLKDLRPHESPQHRLGAEVRHWRLLRGLSQAKLGDAVCQSYSWIAKVENGIRSVGPQQAHDLEAVLEADGAIVRLWEQTDDARDAGGRRRPGPAGEADPWRLWRADAAADPAVGDLPWRPALAETTAADWKPRSPSRPSEPETPFHDAAALRAMAATFDEFDRRFGGGYSRRTLAAYIADQVAPRARAALDRSAATEWTAAAARLVNVGAFMAFDAGLPGLAQQSFSQALTLAKAAGDRILGAHILADMAMQAVHAGHPGQALALAELGQGVAVRGGSWATAARCAAMAMRAHARRGDAAAMRRTMSESEVMLARAEWRNEPEWIRFFSHEQWHVEVVYASAVRGDRATMLRYLPERPLTDRDRQQTLMAATAAAVLLDADGGRPEVEAACELLSGVRPAAVASARTATMLDRARRALAPFTSIQSVHECQQALAPATPRTP